MSDGNPTRINTRAKACERCSRYGGNNRNRAPLFFAMAFSVLRGNEYNCLKSTIL